MSITLAAVRARQPEWFSPQNKRFFGDVSYRVLYGKLTGQPYLVRATYAWTDMFGGPRRLHYRINELADDLTIGSLFDEQFVSIQIVKDWLKGR